VFTECTKHWLDSYVWPLNSSSMCVTRQFNQTVVKFPWFLPARHYASAGISRHSVAFKVAVCPSVTSRPDFGAPTGELGANIDPITHVSTIRAYWWQYGARTRSISITSFPGDRAPFWSSNSSWQIWEFSKNSPSAIPWRKSPKFGTLVRRGDTRRGKIFGAPDPILGELLGVKTRFCCFC